ncbi:MAG: type II toxin-antitoxin system VapC family toxin [Wenzhouxiangella sp.]|nr:type II toxin-antitoxin system VapC family toxin [Wenzhouxiangella sp.]MCH8477130.1 type II toxin-antitoxin system VapC family toxin [Wenzhouxiangella sp.]
MIALDTNVLARFYCDDPDDPEAKRQRPAARRLLEQAPALFVPVTVLLELEWVMRGFYRLPRQDFGRVIRHLLGLPNVTVEDWPCIDQALNLHLKGLDFADALHWSRIGHCEAMASFDRSFARAATRHELTPHVRRP